MTVQPTMRYPVSKTILIGIALSLATYIFDYLPDFYFCKTVYRIVLTAVLILWLAKLGFAEVLSFSWQSFTKGLVCGGFLFLFSLYVLIMNLLSVEAYLSIELAESICNALMIGILEELIWRGALLNVLMRREASPAYKPLQAIFISSIIFGLGHYCNLVYGSSFLEITFQAYSAVCVGVLLAAIYIRCKNIWACAFIHALWNFGNWIGLFIFAAPSPAVSPEASSTVNGLSQILGNMVEPTVFLFIALFLIRHIIRPKRFSAS